MRFKLLILCGVIFAGPSFAKVTPRSKAAIAARVLAYDRALPSSGGTVDVLCVYKDGDAGSNGEARALCDALGKLKVKIQGKSLVAHPVAYSSPGALRSAIDNNSGDIVMVSSGLAGSRAAIKGVIRAKKIRSIGGARGDATAGFAVSIIDDGGKVKILINPDAAAAEGAQYSAKLMKIAERVSGG